MVSFSIPHNYPLNPVSSMLIACGFTTVPNAHSVPVVNSRQLFTAYQRILVLDSSFHSIVPGGLALPLSLAHIHHMQSTTEWEGTYRKGSSGNDAVVPIVGNQLNLFVIQYPTIAAFCFLL